MLARHELEVLFVHAKCAFSRATVGHAAGAQSSLKLTAVARNSFALSHEIHDIL
jgi:hypothetical protein